MREGLPKVIYGPIGDIPVVDLTDYVAMHPGLRNVVCPETMHFAVNHEVYDIETQEFWDNLIAKHPERTHFRVAENLAACVKGGDNSAANVWGEWLTDKKDLVGCLACLEWLHA